jgi:hypothetical protein
MRVRDLAFLPGAGNLSLARGGQPVATQATPDGLWIDAGELAPYSVTALTERRTRWCRGDGSDRHRRAAGE